MAESWTDGSIPGLKNIGPITFTGRFLRPNELLCRMCDTVFTMAPDSPIPHASTDDGVDIGAICDSCAIKELDRK